MAGGTARTYLTSLLGLGAVGFKQVPMDPRSIFASPTDCATACRSGGPAWLCCQWSPARAPTLAVWFLAMSASCARIMHSTHHAQYTAYTLCFRLMIITPGTASIMFNMPCDQHPRRQAGVCTRMRAPA